MFVRLAVVSNIDSLHPASVKNICSPDFKIWGPILGKWAGFCPFLGISYIWNYFQHNKISNSIPLQYSYYVVSEKWRTQDERQVEEETCTKIETKAKKDARTIQVDQHLISSVWFVGWLQCKKINLRWRCGVVWCGEACFFLPSFLDEVLYWLFCRWWEVLNLLFCVFLSAHPCIFELRVISLLGV